MEEKWSIFHVWVKMKIQLTDHMLACSASHAWRERNGINCKSWNCQAGECVGSAFVHSAVLSRYLLAAGLPLMSQALYICQLHTCRQLFAPQSISIWHSIERSTMVFFSPAIDPGFTLQDEETGWKDWARAGREAEEEKNVEGQMREQKGGGEQWEENKGTKGKKVRDFHHILPF